MRTIFTVIFILLYFGQAHAYNIEVTSCKKWDATSINVDTNWLSSNCASQNSTYPVKHTIQVSCPTSTIVELDITTTRSDSSAVLLKTIQVNGGTALPSNSLHQHSFIVTPGDVWNIQHKTTSQSCNLQVFESSDISL